MNGSVAALAVLGTNLFASGSFTAAGGSPANRMAQWDGSVWSALGSGLNNNANANALVASGNALYVGGSFTVAGGKVSPFAAGAILNVSNWLTIQLNIPGTQTNTMTYGGFPGSQYIVQYTTNLGAGPWNRLVTNTPTVSGIGTVVDGPILDPERFYILTLP
jgi:hypothetical protein